ncbi:MAG: DUF262 domain-containing protein [Atopobium sp.]|jgi:hypothetical protein|nr:DUF262 domain-containing protein [Atopobium sp.]
MGSSNLVKPEVWLVSKIVNDIDDKKVILPRYQRAQVWTKKKQESLIDSMMSGFPIGSLLLYENKADETWQLIDGLQRATTIYDYQKNPLRLVNLAILVDRSEKLRDALDDVVSAVKSNQLAEDDDTDETLHEKVQDAIAKWLPTVDISKTSEYSSLKLGSAIVDYFANLENNDSLDGRDTNQSNGEGTIVDPSKILASNAIANGIDASGLLDEIKDEVNLDDYAMPVIIYSGDKKNLPDIFERVNVEGTKLSKYDVLAAIWYGGSDRVLINDSKIRNAIEQKYEEVEETGFVVDESDHANDEYTLYEYLFGLGKYIAGKDAYQLLFKGADDSSKVESFSFTIACIVYHLRIGDIEKLPDAIRQKEGTPKGSAIDLSRFQSALEESIDFICQTLKPYIGIELQKPFIAHKEYQICSYIVRALVGHYDVGSWQERDGWKEDRKALERAIPQHYLYELMTNNWGNAGDSKLFNNVWAGNEPSDVYRRTYEKDEWTNAIRMWFSDGLHKNQTKRAAIDDVSKVFLMYVYGTIANSSEAKQCFDIDHIYPIKILADMLEKTGDTEGLPMSAVGNLEFLESKINKEKNSRTLADYYNSLPEESPKREILKRYSICDNPASVNVTEDWNRSDFVAFIKERERRLEVALLKRFGISL